MTHVTLTQLKSAGACADQVTRFARLFGESVEVTEELALAHAADFNWDWAAQTLLPAAARAEYQRVSAPALTEYQRVSAAALARAYIAEHVAP